jgi:hypothetical protein
MDKRYQVFVSSTFEDLKEERQAVLKGVLELDHMPAGMELFPASDDAAWRLICDVIDASDYYALIIGGRYGSLDEEGIGYTEKEYDYAVLRKKPVIPLLHSNPDNLPRGKTETDITAWKKLEAFRRKVESRHTCVYWGTANELKAQLILGLTATIKRHPAEGWMRASALTSEEASRQIIELHAIIDRQKQELERLSFAPPEGTEDLAQGDDEFELVFNVTFTRNGARYDDPHPLVRQTFKVKVSWNDLFGAFAPEFLEPTRDSKMKAGIACFLRDRFADELRERVPKYIPTSSSISETLFQTLRLQFSALGLITCQTETRHAKDEEKDVRVCVLTPYGRQHLLRVRAIYKKQRDITLDSAAADIAPPNPALKRTRRKRRAP